MAQKTGNGLIHARVVALTTTPAQLNTPNVRSVGIAVQMDPANATADVRIGGSAAGVSATVGWLLVATPATTPTTKPDEWSQTLTGQDVYARTVSGTCNVTVIEVY